MLLLYAIFETSRYWGRVVYEDKVIKVSLGDSLQRMLTLFTIKTPRLQPKKFGAYCYLRVTVECWHPQKLSGSYEVAQRKLLQNGSIYRL